MDGFSSRTFFTGIMKLADPQTSPRRIIKTIGVMFVITSVAVVMTAAYGQRSEGMQPRMAQAHVSTADRAHRIAVNLRYANTMAANYKSQIWYPGWGRDPVMAQNVRWIRSREGTDGGVVVLAHNGHVQTIKVNAVSANTISEIGAAYLKHFGSPEAAAAAARKRRELLEVIAMRLVREVSLK